jgi:ribosomal protein S8
LELKKLAGKKYMSNNFSNFVSILKAGAKAKRKSIVVPFTKFNKIIVNIFYKKGYIASYTLSMDNNSIIIFFRYADAIFSPLANLKIISKPGLKSYVGYRNLIRKYKHKEAYISTSLNKNPISSRKLINSGRINLRGGGEVLFTL